MRVLQRLWNDDAGFIVSAELILIATIAVIGLVVGLTAVRDAVTSELADVAGAIQNVNQSYVWNGLSGHSAAVAGSDFADETDWCDDGEDTADIDLACIIHTQGPLDEGGGLPTVNTP